VPNEWHCVDAENGTIINISLRLKKANRKKGRPLPWIDILMQIQKVSLSEEFSKLNKFSLI
jgi:hypothetical protein